MKALRRTTAAVLAAALTLTCAPAPAYALTIQERKQVMTAVGGLSNTMKLILDNYVGAEVTVQQLYDGAMHGMMTVLDDYSNYYSSEELSEHFDGVADQFYGLGITISMNVESGLVVVRVMADSPAQQAGVLAGDVITEINGATATVENVLELLGGESQAPVEMRVSRLDETISFTIQKDYVNVESVYLEKLSQVLPQAVEEDDNSIGYLCITEFTSNTADEFKAAVRELQDSNTRRVIIDLRGNTGGLLDTSIEICQLLVPEGPIITLSDKSGAEEQILSPLKTPMFERVVILTDGFTASASEILVSAMKDAGAATVVGGATYGKGVGQAVLSVEFGGAMDLTVLEFFSRNGNKINTVGVTPNVVVETPVYIRDAVSLDENGCSPLIIDIKGALSYLGYPTGEPGEYYDETTMASVMTLQRYFSLNEDGVLGYDTVSAINTALYESLNDPALKKAYEIIAE